jgi:hypothetical protein
MEIVKSEIIMTKDLKGKIAIKFFNDLHFEELCIKHIPGYQIDRFNIIAVRVFSAKEFIITVFAVDKESHKTLHSNKFAVKKFKIENLAPAEFLKYVEAFNFTVADDEFHIDEMEIINK